MTLISRFFYRRSLTTRSGDQEPIVYMVESRDGKPDPVPVLGFFPPFWRPTDRPGMVFFDRDCVQQPYPCEIPRSSFRHYTRITEAEALALYPRFADEIRFGPHEEG